MKGKIAFLDEDVMGSGGWVPRILDVTGLRSMGSFTSRQPYFPDDIAGTHGEGGWVIPVAVLDAVDKRKGFYLCKESKSDRDMAAVSNELCVVFEVKGKGKSVPLQAWSGPEDSRKLRFTDFMTTAQDGGKVVSLIHRPPLPPGNTPGIHFC
jgi:hypothetical protein